MLLGGKTMQASYIIIREITFGRLAKNVRRPRLHSTLSRLNPSAVAVLVVVVVFE